MKIALASDLHLEFAPIVLENTEGAEVLLLAGDICEANKFEKRLPFFEQVARDFPLVIYILGNHEHYNYDFKYTAGDLKKQLAHLKNVVLLDTETYTHGDVTFIGGTLWTDMNKEDSLTMFHVKRAMSDYHVIKNSNRMVNRKVPIYEKNPNYTEDGRNGGQYKIDENGYYIKIGDKFKQETASFAPEDTVEYYKKMLDYIKIVTTMVPESKQKYVVVGHHAPSKASTHPRYLNDTTMNGAYSSDLCEFILDRPQIKLWVHGHTHDSFDYMIGSTRVVCNPRGYDGHERQADFFELKFMEI
jgi:Icc-related predicted phosphoesterase